MIDFIPNSFTTPNAYVDRLMPLLTPEEFVTLLYAARRIFGFQKRQDRISLSQFTTGTISRETGEHHDYGTGLNLGTVRKAIANLEKFKIFMKVAENDPMRNEGALYELQPDGREIRFDLLEQRRQEWAEVNARRTAAARIAPRKGEGGAVRQQGSEGGLSHSTPPENGGLSHSTPPMLSHSNTKDSMEKQLKEEGKTESSSSGKPADGSIGDGSFVPSEQGRGTTPYGVGRFPLPVPAGFPQTAEKGLVLALWNENAAYTACIPTGKSNYDLVGQKNIFAVHVRSIQSADPALATTTTDFLLILEKKLRQSILQTPEQSISMEFLQSECESFMASIQIPSGTELPESIYSIALAANNQVVWAGTVSFVAATATRTPSSTLTISYLDTKVVPMMRQIDKSSALTATSAKPTASGPGTSNSRRPVAGPPAHVAADPQLAAFWAWLRIDQDLGAANELVDLPELETRAYIERLRAGGANEHMIVKALRDAGPALIAKAAQRVQAAAAVPIEEATPVMDRPPFMPAEEWDQIFSPFEREVWSFAVYRDGRLTTDSNLDRYIDHDYRDRRDRILARLEAQGGAR